MSKIIPGEDLAACQRWMVPEMGARKGPMTAARMESLHEQARNEGFRQGLEEGRAAGLEQIEAQLGQLGELVAAFGTPLAALDRELEEQIAHLALLVAKQIVRRELRHEPQQIVGVVREALAILPASGRQVRVLVHPEDAVIVREALALQQDTEAVSVVDDPAQGRGGCRVLTETSRIDATVEARLNAVMAQVLGGERSDDR